MGTTGKTWTTGQAPNRWVLARIVPEGEFRLITLKRDVLGLPQSKMAHYSDEFIDYIFTREEWRNEGIKEASKQARNRSIDRSIDRFLSFFLPYLLTSYIQSSVHGICVILSLLWSYCVNHLHFFSIFCNDYLFLPFKAGRPQTCQPCWHWTGHSSEQSDNSSILPPAPKLQSRYRFT